MTREDYFHIYPEFWIFRHNFLDSNLLQKEQNLSGFFLAFSNLLFQDTLGKEFPEYRDT